MTPNPPRPAFPMRPPSLAVSLEVGLALRVLAACVVHWYASNKGTLCVFGDTAIYWELARAVRAGEPYQVMQFDVPHFALRTPGYPIFLAACQALFGDRLMPVRLVQAALNAASVAGVYALAARLLPARPAGAPEGWATPRAAALLASVDPYTVGMSALVLSEGVFMPLMVLALWGLSVLWVRPGEDSPTGRKAAAAALATGGSIGLAVLVRPSWALFPPAALAAWVILAGAGRRRAAIRGAALVALGAALVMAPWWARNARVYGKFVPTALWFGASLYDGLRPDADGSSDMRFIEAPDVAPLGEEEQDAELTRRALAFARSEPARAGELAWRKFLRFWSPWPNADQLRSKIAAALSAAWTVPLFALLALGAWDRRGDPRALVLLLGTLLYFCAVHLFFVSSIRYRVPGMLPALALTALGAGRLAGAVARGRMPGRIAIL